MTIADAAHLGIARVRSREWADPNAYLKIAIVTINGKRGFGPCLELYERKTQEIIGEPTPQMVPVTLGDTLQADVVEYKGPIDPADHS